MSDHESVGSGGSRGSHEDVDEDTKDHVDASLLTDVEAVGEAKSAATDTALATRSHTPTKPTGPSHVLHINLFNLAAYYLGGFLLTFIPTAIVTFLWTEYNRETDFIWGFFGVFNPCMFFDHYPANIVATFGITVWMALGAAYVFVLFQVVRHMQSGLYTTMSGILFAFVGMAELFFVNILTANIYVGFDEAHLPCCNEPGWPNFGITLPQATKTRIATHGGFYNITLAFHVLHCLWFLGAVKYIYSGYKVPGWVYFVLIFNILVQVCAMEGMLTVIFSGGFNTDAFQYGLTEGRGWSLMQQWAIKINRTFNVGFWNWMLALSWRMLVIPRRLGVGFEFTLGGKNEVVNSPPSDHMTPCCGIGSGNVCGNTKQLCGKGWFNCFRPRASKTAVPPGEYKSNVSFEANTVYPLGVFASTYKMVIAMMLFTYLVQDPEQVPGAGTLLAISSGFRQLPYAYVFAPMWILITMMTAWGIYLTLVLHKLEHGSERAGWYKAKLAVGIVWVVAMVCDLFIIVPTFDATEVAAIVTLLAIPAWVGVAYKFTWRTAVWIALWIILAPLATDEVSGKYGVYPAVLMACVLIALPYVDPSARGLHCVTVVQHTDGRITRDD